MQYTETCMVAVLGKLIRYKNISILVINCVRKKKHPSSLPICRFQSFVLEYGGPSRRN